MSDFAAGTGGATAPIRSIVACTPDNTATFAATRAIFIDAAAVAAIKFTTDNAEDITLNNLAVGVWHPMRITKVYATGTSQTGIKLGY